MKDFFKWFLRFFTSPEPARRHAPSIAYPDAIELIAGMVERQRASRSGCVSVSAKTPTESAVVAFADDSINTCEAEIDLRSMLLDAGEPALFDLVQPDPVDRTMHKIRDASTHQIGEIIRIIQLVEHGASPDEHIEANLHR